MTVYNPAVVGLPYYTSGRQGILVHNTKSGGWFGSLKRLLGLGDKPSPEAAQPNKGALDLYRDKAFRERVGSVGVDCAQLASELLDASGNQGGELVFSPGENATRVFHPEKDGLVDSNYHSVYTDGNFVFDPRCRDTPIPRSAYEALMKDKNPGVQISFNPARPEEDRL